jgi:hypothetical protein
MRHFAIVRLTRVEADRIIARRIHATRATALDAGYDYAWFSSDRRPPRFAEIAGLSQVANCFRFAYALEGAS